MKDRDIYKNLGIFPKYEEREGRQKSCNCRHDPGKSKGTCRICGGWVS